MDLATHAEAIAALYSPPATGRPSSISDAETLKELFKQIEAGNYLETACELAGLNVVTVHNWKKRGEAGEEPYAQFIKALKRASARAEALAVANVRQAGKLPQFWAAEMTYLERRHPERWGRRQESSDGPRVVVQIGVKDSDVQISLGVVSPSESALLKRKSDETGLVFAESEKRDYVNGAPASTTRSQVIEQAHDSANAVSNLSNGLDGHYGRPLPSAAPTAGMDLPVVQHRPGHVQGQSRRPPPRRRVPRATYHQSALAARSDSQGPSALLIDPPADSGARSPEGPTPPPARVQRRRRSAVKSRSAVGKEKKA